MNVTASYDPARRTSIRGATAAAPFRLEFTVVGGGSFAPGNGFVWSIYEVNNNSRIINAVWGTAPVGVGPMGVWRTTITASLFVDARGFVAGVVAGIERSSGRAVADLRILIESPYLRIDWTQSPVFYVTA